MRSAVKYHLLLILAKLTSSEVFRRSELMCTILQIGNKTFTPILIFLKVRIFMFILQKIKRMFLKRGKTNNQKIENEKIKFLLIFSNLFNIY